jgi:caffeoyl-CoA O-methyltransferase
VSAPSGPPISESVRDYLDALGFGDTVRYRVGEAVQALRESEGGLDLVFNDIDKEGYPEALEVVEEKLRPGGVLITDNLLWGGRIFDPENREAGTEGVRELTRRVTSSPRWISTLVPIRNGLLVARKQ